MATPTKEFNVSLMGRVSFFLSQRNERFQQNGHLQGEMLCRNTKFYRKPIEQGCFHGKCSVRFNVCQDLP